MRRGLGVALLLVGALVPLAFVAFVIWSHHYYTVGVTWSAAGVLLLAVMAAPFVVLIAVGAWLASRRSRPATGSAGDAR